MWKMVPRMKELYSKSYKIQENVHDTVVEITPVKTKSNSDIIIEGVDDMLINLAKCCNPMRGDKIVGYITRGNGVSIHKCSCNNVINNINNPENSARWVNARWNDVVSKNETYQTTIEIVAIDRTGLLADITSLFGSMHIYINSFGSSESKNSIASIRFTITVNSIDHLKVIFSRLSAIDGVQSVSRI